MMNWQYTPYVLPLVITAAISATIAFFAWRRRPAPGAVPLGYLMLAVCEWSLGYAVGMASADLPAKVFWAKVQYFGIVSVPIMWLFLALQYTNRERWLTRRNWVLLAIMPLLTLLLVWTNESHGLIWSDIRLDTSGSFSVLYLSYGAFAWVWVMYSYPLILLGSVLLLQALIRSPHLYRRQAAAMLVAALAPWVGNVLRISGLNPFPQLDPTNFAFALSGLTTAWALFRFRLLDLVPVARDAVIEAMSDGMIVLDAQNRIVDINLAAGRIFGHSVSEAIGQPAAQVLYGPPDLIERYRDTTEAQGEIVLGEGEAQRIFDLRISPLYDQHDRLTGRLVVLRDFTERKQAEEELREYRDQLEELVEERTTELTRANEQLQREITERKRVEEALQQFNEEILRRQEAALSLAEDLRNEIDERKRAEEALRESEQNFKDLAENSPDGIIIADANGVHLYANRRAAEITGYSVDELVGMTGWDLTRPEDVNKFKQRMKKRMADEPHVGKYERFFVRKDGTEVLTEMSTTTTMWQGKKRPLAIIRDITERKRAEEARAHGQRTLLALSQAAQAVQRAHTPEEVYCTIGDEVSRLGYNAVIFILTDDREHLALRHLTFEPTLVQRIRKLTGLSAQDFRFPLRPDGCFQRVITEGEAIFRESSLELMIEALPQPLHPLVGRLTAMLGTEQGIVTPLAIGGEAHGVLAVTGAGLTEADVPAVTAFANQGAIAIENARLYEAEHTARQQLRDLTNYLQTAREEERTYIAREIHDEFGQALTALKMDLSWLTKRLPADKPGLAEKASVMWGLIDDTIQTVRRVAARLRPGLLDDLGLAAAIEWQVGEFAERTEIDCQLYMSDEEIALDHDLATAVFRILQETLTNIARHAQATEVRVELEVRPDELVLAMCDNGKGITEGEVSDPRSLGLIGMRERARSWGGDVTFEGVPGQGTTVTVRIPNAEFGMRNAESFR